MALPSSVLKFPNIGGSTIGRFAYPYSPPSILKNKFEVEILKSI